jgi:hypothetical protein
MQTQTIAAEQSSRSAYQRQTPMPPREIERSVRLEIPKEDYEGVHSGLANVDAPFPAGGIGVHLTHLRFFPSLEFTPNESDVQRLGDALGALTAATVASLWNGIISLGAPALP